MGHVLEFIATRGVAISCSGFCCFSVLLFAHFPCGMACCVSSEGYFSVFTWVLPHCQLQWSQLGSCALSSTPLGSSLLCFWDAHNCHRDGRCGIFNPQKPWVWHEQRAVKRLGDPRFSSLPSVLIHFRRTAPVSRPNLKVRLCSTYLIHYIQVCFIKELRQKQRKHTDQTFMPYMFQTELLKLLQKINQCIWKGKILFICSCRRCKGLGFHLCWPLN